MTKSKMIKEINKLEWYVLVHDFNEHKFVEYNIIREDLADDIYKLISKNPDAIFADIKEVIRKWAMYHYWSKCEWEMVVADLWGKDETKIDVYRQIEPNLDRLTEYIVSELQI